MAKISSGVWGNKDFEVSQGFGVYNADTAYMYNYSANLGYRAGTHVGIDVAMPRDTPIYAAADGVVSQAGASDYFRPNPVWIEAADNPDTSAVDPEIHIYGHLWENTVNVGEAVKRGQLIGYSGEQTIKGTMTPDKTGPHLHFERRNAENSKALDPVPLLTGTTASDTAAADTGTGDGPASDTGGILGGLVDSAAAAGGRIGLGILGLVGVALAFMLMTGASPLDLVPAGRALKAVRGAVSR